MESAFRSREEDYELQCSTKKVKENHCMDSPRYDATSLPQKESSSYKEKLVGEIPGAFERAFDVGPNMEIEAESDDELADLPTGEKVVKFSRDMKAKIRAPWVNALIVKVFGKIMGYHFLYSRLLNLWKPKQKMDCVGLGSDFFLIKF